MKKLQAKKIKNIKEVKGGAFIRRGKLKQRP